MKTYEATCYRFSYTYLKLCKILVISHLRMADLVANVTEFDDVTKINAKESSSKLEEYFIETLEKGVEVKKRPLMSFTG